MIETDTGYMSVTQAATLWVRSRNTVKKWCIKGQIPGVTRIGNQYAIPATAAPPHLKRGRAAKGKE
jgi:CYTH domain-containing protein